ncbi:MAG: WYL domain-containing protein [Chloroflexi bacterium]|nr:WYL domain-containing protein [Chloroflexota bacterium]
MAEQPDGSIIVTLTIPDLEAATSIIMNYGYLAVVLEPEELRELVLERAKVIAARHASTDQIK